LASELGLLSGPAEQILDSTPMLGAAAVQDTAVLVRAAVRKLLDAVNAVDEEAAGDLRSGLRFDYSKPRVKPEGDWQDREARMRLLVEVEMDAARALQAVECDPALMAAGHVAEAAPLLREIIGQQIELADDDVPRVRRGRDVLQIEVLAPCHIILTKDGTIPKERFTIDLDSDTVTYPEGNRTPIYKPRANRKTTSGERVARFAQEDCEPCPLRQRCAPSGQRDI